MAAAGIRAGASKRHEPIGVSAGFARPPQTRSSRACGSGDDVHREHCLVVGGRAALRESVDGVEDVVDDAAGGGVFGGKGLVEPRTKPKSWLDMLKASEIPSV